MQAIYAEEVQRAGAPPILGNLGVILLVPALLEFGTAWQRESYVEHILSAELIFCQGYSEPGAGSDLAALESAARRQGSGWLISGHKTWSSLAHQRSEKTTFIAPRRRSANQN